MISLEDVGPMPSRCGWRKARPAVNPSRHR
jgi:hypothetical protein